MPANNSRNIKSCLTAVNTDTDSDSVIWVEIPKCCNYFALVIFFLTLPLCPGCHFLSLSLTTVASLLFSLVSPYLSLSVVILPFFLHPYVLGFHPIAVFFLKPVRHASGVALGMAVSVCQSILVGWNCEILCRFPGDEFSYGDSLTFTTTTVHVF